MKENSYTVEFELFGKKMKLTNVEAHNEEAVKRYVENKIIFHSVTNNTKIRKEYDDITNLYDLNLFKSMFGDIFK